MFPHGAELFGWDAAVLAEPVLKKQNKRRARFGRITKHGPPYVLAAVIR